MFLGEKVSVTLRTGGGGRKMCCSGYRNLDHASHLQLSLTAPELVWSSWEVGCVAVPSLCGGPQSPLTWGATPCGVRAPCERAEF